MEDFGPHDRNYFFLWFIKGGMGFEHPILENLTRGRNSNGIPLGL